MALSAGVQHSETLDRKNNDGIKTVKTNCCACVFFMYVGLAAELARNKHSSSGCAVLLLIAAYLTKTRGQELDKS